MKKATLFLLLFCLGFIHYAMAQHKTVVYGNLGVGNVNISIVNTRYGTSTDTKGHYNLPLFDRTKTINLYYSCIGFQDTVVSLSPKQLQHDSIHVSFKMRKLDYNLQEVTVTAKPKLYGERYYFMDFEAFDQAICILAACPNKKFHCLIMTDEDLRGFDTIPIPAHITPKLVIRDCMGNCQLIANDSVYEIDLTTEQHKFLAVDRAFYFRTMSDCLFATNEHIYFKEKGMQDYFTSFYRISRETKKPQQLFMSNATDALDNYYRELEFAINNGGGPPLGVWARYIRKHWYHPNDAELLLSNDTLYYFDQSLGNIQRYDLGIHKIDSCIILYPFMEGWKHILYQDLVQNKFYTVVKNQMFEINPLSGSISPKTKLTPSLYPKIIIHNGQLLLLKKALDSFGERITFIERRKL